MSNYEGRKTGEIRICYDSHRANPWYAKAPIIPKEDDPVFRKLLSETSALEIKLKSSNIKEALRIIISELKRKGISTTTLRVRPYQN